ncbi:endosome sorting protein (SNF7 homologue), putative [Theileria annulata]|uniref:Endosome sorting protein (SNF7 homologue), putative n=1 Tax=Theileria annulata TaxID=5874 RepID=Q4UAF9_THEAN|nr:endosome sorting protein (SNF7 homologue), putative [Theileria annulata]CAI76192.1 endosome sorting protein (SNF7 homologue), putative [Theileria annulata]|eukprot:XP_952817.1 endosome sorting protein (SNF7 homologue), putative [Theileria annulata]
MVFGFGKNKKSPVKDVSKAKKTEIDLALANSENTLNYLTKKQEILENKINECVNLALECSKRNDKANALSHLRRKKLLTNELNKLRSTLIALETQSIALEGAQMQHMAISALSDSLHAQKYLQSSIDSNKFDDLLDELEESKEIQQEILDTMTSNLSSNLEVTNPSYIIHSLFPSLRMN